MFHISSFGEKISTQGEKSKMARYLVKIQFPSTRSQDELLLRCPTLPFCTSVSLLRLPWLLFDNTAGPKSEDRLIICCENSKYGFDENFYGYFALAQRVPTFATWDRVATIMTYFQQPSWNFKLKKREWSGLGSLARLSHPTPTSKCPILQLWELIIFF